MKTPITLKTLFAAYAAAMMTLAAQAEKTAKVVWDKTANRLTFVYDEADYGTKGTDWFSVAEAEAQAPESFPAWASDPWKGPSASVTNVVIDESFKDYRPKHCGKWFWDFDGLKTIDGISNLDISKATSLYGMFYGCKGLVTLDLSSFDTANIGDMSWMFFMCFGLKNLELSSSFNTANVTNMTDMFCFSAVEDLDVSHFDTRNVECMVQMFARSTVTNLDLSNFNTQKVRDMEGLFEYCDDLESLNVSSFNTASVTNMSSMFSGCKKLKSLDLSSFDTRNVEAMDYLFYGCNALSAVDVSGFRTPKATRIKNMFAGCQSLASVDVSGFDTSHVTSLWGLFQNCTNLVTLDVSSFDTANVTDMYAVFDGCTQLKTIYASESFVTNAVTDDLCMFRNCKSLVGGNGTTYDDDQIGAAYACIDRVGQKGYFTEEAMFVGHYFKRNLVDDLGVVIPSDVSYAAGDKVTVKVEGLAKGLKLVSTPVYEDPLAKKKVIVDYDYTIEGVPTEAIDVATQPMYARVTTTYKDKTKGKVETLQPLNLTIKAATVRSLNAGVLSCVYGPVDIATLWPEVADAKTNPKDWTFKSWPAGLKYNATAKPVAWTYKVDGVTTKTNAPAWTVYGIPTKAGEFALTATHKRKLEDGKTTVSETLSATLTVWGDDGETSFRYTDQAYVAIPVKIWSDVKSASGLPTGIKFNSKDGKVTGTPTKAGVYAVALTKTDKSKETFLWKVTEGANDGFLSAINWEVRDSTVTVMQGVIQTNWNVTVSSAAKVTASGLPTGLKLAQDKTTKAWTLSGTPTKTGNFVVTFKTVLNGVTKTERIAMVVTANAYTGNWYAAPIDDHTASWTAYISVAAGGTVKLILTEGTTNANAKGVIQSQVTKTTVTAKNLDGDGKSVYLTLPRDKKVAGSVDRSCVIDFDEKTIKINGDEQSAYIYYQAPFDFDVPAVATMVVEEFVEGEDGNSTNAFAYLTATYTAAKGLVGVQGKLYDGTAVKATTYALEDANGGCAPFLVTDKSKNSISILISYTANKVKGEFRLMQCAVFVNGQLLRVGKASLNPSWDGFDSAEAKLLKSTKFSDMTSATNLVVSLTADASTGRGLSDAAIAALALTRGVSVDAVVSTASLPIPVKSLATKLTAQGLVTFKNLKDADGWTWTCELLPTGEMKEGDTPFRGIATGTWKNPVTKKTETFACPVRTE